MNTHTVLIVEDDPRDQFFLKHAFDDIGLKVELKFANSAEDALEHISSGFLPTTIVTDLSMPGMGGFGLLDRLKQNEVLRRIPTIVFSGSSLSEDIQKAYDKFANSYVVKPSGLDGYETFARHFRDYWLETNRSIN